ncbi:MAG: molybdopterin oxidoreductase family protein, partial [Anaerolineae bacterium]
GHHFTGSPNRLTTPLIKKEGRFVEASWDEALSLAAQKLGQAGAGAGGIAGPRLANEDLYLFQKLFREVLGSGNLDHRVGLNAALEDRIGHEVGAGSGTDIGRLGSGSAILVIGADVDQEAPVLYLRLRGAARRGAHLINAGGRPTKLDHAAQTVLRVRYGAAAHLVWGMVAAVLDEGLENKPFVSSRVQGLSAVTEPLKTHTPARAAAVTGLTEDDIRAAARAFAAAEDGLILFGLEAGSDPALQAAIKALALLTGHAGRAGNGVIAVLPHANSRGAADLGLLPDRLPGYLPAAGKAGLSARQMLGADSGLAALYIAAADPAAESDAANAAIKATGFVVAQDLFMTHTAQLADVVLPAAGVAERDGSFTNLERRVQAFDAAVPAPGQARPDWLIIAAIAGRLGADWTFASVGGVMAEITRTVPLYAGMSFDNLLAPITLARKMSHYIYSGMSFTAAAREGLQWPAAAEDESTTFSLEFVSPAAPPAAELTLVAVRALYDGGVLINEAAIVAAHIQPPQVLLSEPDAARLGVSDGDEVTLSANGVSVTLPVRVGRPVPAGVVLVPRNVAGQPAERLLNGRAAFAPVTAVKKTVAEPA